ncbi:LLM class flavin-dependent oxidoreductase [Kribbella sp. NPDC003505]|uniref:LLM class flavin-dependent oxidoreductase n=1 Tax=Kribbella sp. NPDC003505 TaxID=3154448 RepID=UPI00339EE1B2
MVHRPQDPGSAGIRSALWLPIFDDLADPLVVARLAADAEEAGWHGLFVWDHLLWRKPVEAVADPWITLAAVASATERLRFGPMISPIVRRRPAKLARETATLDCLGAGRLTLGVGIGSDRFAGEFSKTGEQSDDRVRGRMLDESLQVLSAAWSGEVVNHHGPHYTVEGMRFLPRPLQRPGIPVWVAGFPGNAAPMRRAARHDGFFPVNFEHPDELAEAVSVIDTLRSAAGRDLSNPYDVAVGLPAGVDLDPFAAAGATWWMTEFDPAAVSLDEVRGVLRDGPA